MTQTIVDEIDRTFLLLRGRGSPATTAAGRGAAPRGGAYTSATRRAPLAGLYAFADTLVEARDAVAVLAWTAVMAGELVPFGYTADDLAGIHVAVTTSTAYDAAWLTAAVANDAAWEAA